MIKILYLNFNWFLYYQNLKRFEKTLLIYKNSERILWIFFLKINITRINAKDNNKMIRFIKLGDQMCELNYEGTKIEIKVKLGDQKYNFT